MQEACGYKPATVSQRLCAVAGFYRICVIDGALEHSPADYVTRLRVAGLGPDEVSVYVVDHFVENISGEFHP